MAEMDKAERMALTARHPGVRRLKRARECEAWMFRSTKAIREGRVRRCKNPAYWHFTPLKRKYMDNTEPRYLCWSHLYHQGIYGDMDEEERTERWLKRMEAMES